MGAEAAVARIRSLYERQQNARKMENLLYVGYLLNNRSMLDLRTMEQAHDSCVTLVSVPMGEEPITLVLSSMEDTLPDGSEWKMYFVHQEYGNGDAHPVFSADYKPTGLEFEYEPGPWEKVLEFGYTLKRSELLAPVEKV